MFSFGIMLAEIIARIPADPDFMPRTQVSGVHMLVLCVCVCMYVCMWPGGQVVQA